ncbi:Group XV phospholipase A2 [Fragariocoptes setiger]|uniref:Group XV phospholipase A2 n=1 Tax=Fragariocoptes setiger TaxID=1670756 RepID=A0ABQ7S980_9ACAR|nr:Group XV phospholipase A2 [Fragariocoptes setiger]
MRARVYCVYASIYLFLTILVWPTFNHESSFGEAGWQVWAYQPATVSKPESRSRLSPIILIPGDGGSRLEARLNKSQVLHHYCGKKSDDWFDLWLNLSLLVPFALDCWVDNMKLTYNATTRKTENSPGVEIRVSGFGKTEPVEYIDPAKVMGTGYFQALVEHLVSLGYERDRTIHGAPYDFRRAPNELSDYYKQLTKLIENTYHENGDERVILVCHSLGCLNSHYFLSKRSNVWKDKFIRSMISLSGVWGGSVKAMKAFASGDNFGVLTIPNLSLRKDERTFPSLAYLMPSADVWPHSQVLLQNGDKKFTVNDYKQFFRDINHPTGYEMWLDTRNLTSPLVPPGVEVHCLHGYKVSTIKAVEYGQGEFPDGKPRITFEDGDGTVNLISLQACRTWQGKQNAPVHYKNFTLVDHMTIMSNQAVLDYIAWATSKTLEDTSI